MEIEKLLTSDRISFDLKWGNKEEVIDESIEFLYKDEAVNNKKDFKLASSTWRSLCTTNFKCSWRNIVIYYSYISMGYNYSHYGR